MSLALIGAPAAGASVQLMIDGAGDGHGVGMSQTGAEGLALHGYTDVQILAHYYTGTALGSVPPSRTVRVLMRSDARSVSFTDATDAGGHPVSAGRTYRATLAADGEIAVRAANGDPVATVARPLRVTSSTPLTLLGTASNGVRDGRYDGSLQISPAPGGEGLDVINVVGIESYVRGVVAEESPAGWSAAELEAQAIASRTFALTAGPITAGFDLYADSRSQLYGGLAAQTPSTDAAVAGTRGQIVTYGEKAARTFFFSSSGGETESIQDAFLGAAPEPWLRAVADPYDHVRYGPITMSLARAARQLGPLLRGTLTAIRVTRRGASPRVLRAQILGSDGTTTVSGLQLQRALALPSAWACFAVTDAAGTPPRGWNARCATPTGSVTGATGPTGATGATGASGPPPTTQGGTGSPPSSSGDTGSSGPSGGALAPQ